MTACATLAALHDATGCRAPGQSGHREIDGVGFVTFTAPDAAMSHHLDVHSYRSVREGICYTIDLMVYGVNPQVFDPPAISPFDDAQAFTRMQAVLETFRFTRQSALRQHPGSVR